MNYLSGLYSYLPSVPYLSSTQAAEPEIELESFIEEQPIQKVVITPEIDLTKEKDEKFDALKKLTRNTRIKQAVHLSLALLSAVGMVVFGVLGMLFGATAIPIPFAGHLIGPTSVLAGYGALKLGISGTLSTLSIMTSILAAWKLEQSLKQKRQELTQESAPQVQQKPEEKNSEAIRHLA